MQSLQDFLNYFRDIEVRRVDSFRVWRYYQRRRPARRISSIAHGDFVALTLSVPSTGTHLRRSIEEKFERRFRKNDRTNVAALDDDVAVRHATAHLQVDDFPHPGHTAYQ